MSIRVYRGPHREMGGPSSMIKLSAWIFFALGVISSAFWPFCPVDRKDSLTVFIIFFFFLASTFHAFIWWDIAWAATFMIVSLAVSFSLLAINSATGLIFGDVTYTYRLGYQILFVPIVAPLIWSSACYYAIVIARRISRGVFNGPLIAAIVATSLIVAADSLFIKMKFHEWLTWIDKPNIYGNTPFKFIGATFVITLVIMYLTGENSKNDRYSTKMPILTYTWIFAFTIFSARILNNNVTEFATVLTAMTLILVSFIYKTIKNN